MFAMAIHGGAGTLPRTDMSAEAERRYRAGLNDAIDAGFAVLQGGGTSMDAVTRAVVLLEDNPLFNAGKGAVFTLDGRNELIAVEAINHSKDYMAARKLIADRAQMDAVKLADPNIALREAI